MEFGRQLRWWRGALRSSLLGGLALLAVTVTASAFELGGELPAFDSFAALNMRDGVQSPFEAGGSFYAGAAAWQVLDFEAVWPEAALRVGFDRVQGESLFVHDNWKMRHGGMAGFEGGYGRGNLFGDDDGDTDCSRHCRDFPMAVPEPGSPALLLAGAGAAGLLLSLRAHRKTRSR
jgi:hypothetical protein